MLRKARKEELVAVSVKVKLQNVFEMLVVEKAEGLYLESSSANAYESLLGPHQQFATPT